jgi:hypothetical protein
MSDEHAAPAAPDASAAPARHLELADFRPHENTVFQLSGDGVPGAPLPLTLVETRTLVAGDGLANRSQPFGLTFRGPASPALPQRIYRLDHPEVGGHEIFLVPVARRADGALDYEAIFT